MPRMIHVIITYMLVQMSVFVTLWILTADIIWSPMLITDIIDSLCYIYITKPTFNHLHSTHQITSDNYNLPTTITIKHMGMHWKFYNATMKSVFPDPVTIIIWIALPLKQYDYFYSAGIGQTGTFIAVDIELQRIKQEGLVDVYNTVCKLRHGRMSSVQMQVSHQSNVMIQFNQCIY